ncbi:MAG: hypothetical protein K0V04_18665, partial [Deltaproteobacteria bacterium]|nr:hypothetical protein [Deltaproteobacteria bacterium]
MIERSDRHRSTRILVVVLGLAGLAWLASGATLARATAPGVLDRLFALVSAFAHPALDASTLQHGLRLAVETIAVATWGTALGAAAGLVAAVLASDRIAHRPHQPRRWWRRARVELVRAGLDVLRAIPDFAWALVALVFVGAGPVTGIIAIAISVTGILGKTYSQLLDATPPARVETVEATGAPRLVVALWGHIPAASGAMLSYTLLRLECSMRNASVIGIVGGG